MRSNTTMILTLLLGVDMVFAIFFGASAITGTTLIYSPVDAGLTGAFASIFTILLESFIRSVIKDWVNQQEEMLKIMVGKNPIYPDPEH